MQIIFFSLEGLFHNYSIFVNILKKAVRGCLRGCSCKVFSLKKKFSTDPRFSIFLLHSLSQVAYSFTDQEKSMEKRDGSE
jgi:hypothetical protein